MMGTDARASGMPLPEGGRDQNHAPAGGLSGAAPAAQRRAGERSLRRGPERLCARLPRRGGVAFKWLVPSLFLLHSQWFHAPYNFLWSVHPYSWRDHIETLRPNRRTVFCCCAESVQSDFMV